MEKFYSIIGKLSSTTANAKSRPDLLGIPVVTMHRDLGTNDAVYDNHEHFNCGFEFQAPLNYADISANMSCK